MNLLLYVIHFLIILTILFSLFSILPKGEKYLITAAAIIKMIAGLAVGFIYINYFNGGDSLRYFEEARSLYDNPHVNILSVLTGDYNAENSTFANQPRAQFFLQITYFIYSFALGDFWLISIYFSLITFFGALYFYHSAKKRLDIDKPVLIMALFFWPSIVFWSSGIIKESVSLAFIYLVAGSFLSLVFSRKKTVIHFIIIALGTIVLLKIKYYYAAVLIPVLFSLAVAYFSKRLFPDQKKHVFILIFFLVLGVCIYGSTLMHPNLNVERIVEVMVNNYYLFEVKSDPAKMVTFENLSPHYTELLYYSPKALFAGWFRPFVWDIKNIWSAIAGIENIVLFVFLLFQLKNLRHLNKLLVLATLVYCLIMAVFLSYSAPNFGTLVRYKVGFLPFLVLLTLYRNPLLVWTKKKSGI